MAGYWGQISFRKAVEILTWLLKEFRSLELYVLCGTNESLRNDLQRLFQGESRMTVYGEEQANLSEEVLSRCGCIITKPGYSTLVEAHAAGRQIFLIKGMPVAEEHNADYALKYLGAQWFQKDAFRSWYDSQVSHGVSN